MSRFGIGLVLPACLSGATLPAARTESAGDAPRWPDGRGAGIGKQAYSHVDVGVAKESHAYRGRAENAGET